MPADVYHFPLSRLYVKVSKRSDAGNQIAGLETEYVA
jgi:hypothetical protein